MPENSSPHTQFPTAPRLSQEGRTYYFGHGLEVYAIMRAGNTVPVCAFTAESDVQAKLVFYRCLHTFRAVKGNDGKGAIYGLCKGWGSQHVFHSDTF